MKVRKEGPHFGSVADTWKPRQQFSTDPWKLRKVGQAKQDEIREENKPGRHKKGDNYVGMKEVETCPNVSQQPGAVIKSVNLILGCINRSMTCRSHGVICLF